MGTPTQNMIYYATDLLQQLRYDLDIYDFDRMTFKEVSELIEELKDERGD